MFCFALYFAFTLYPIYTIILVDPNVPYAKTVRKDAISYYWVCIWLEHTMRCWQQQESAGYWILVPGTQPVCKQHTMRGYRSCI